MGQQKSIVILIIGGKTTKLIWENFICITNQQRRDVENKSYALFTQIVRHYSKTYVFPHASYSKLNLCAFSVLT